MPIVIDTGKAPASIRITVHGAWPTIEETRHMWQSLIRHGHLTDTTAALFDIRMVDGVPGYEAVRNIVASALAQGAWPLRRAYLVGSAVQFGLVRQMQAMAPPNMQLEVFTVEREALEWLAAKPG